MALGAAGLVAAGVGVAVVIRPEPRPDPAAVREVTLGDQCAERAVWGQDCSAHYRRAAALDPTLPSAHLGLAIWLRWFGGSVTEQRAAIARARAHAGRSPPKERMLVDAWAAHLDGREDEAIALLEGMTRRWPDDPRGAYELSDLLRHRDELDAAIPLLDRAASLDPESAWAAGALAEALGALDRTDALRAWDQRWSAVESPAALHGSSIARGWLGDLAGAAKAARSGLALGSLTAQEDLLGAMVMAGRYAEVAEGCRPMAARGSPVRRMGHYCLAAIAAYQGRRREGLDQLDALERELPETATDAAALGVRADFLLGDGDGAQLRRVIDRLRAVDPRAAAELAPSLAWLGAVDAAALVAQDLRPGSLLADTYAAIAAHRSGDPAGLDRLRAAVERCPITTWRVAPLWLYGDLAARAGRDAEAIRALERLERLYLPRTMWRSWAHPRALVLLAGAHERLGHGAEARAAIADHHGLMCFKSALNRLLVSPIALPI
jgi:predicted Zn-dependent protease